MKPIVALVTGGASGLGRGTVERFVKLGSKVILADLPTSKGGELAKTLGPQVTEQKFTDFSFSIANNKLIGPSTI